MGERQFELQLPEGGDEGEGGYVGIIAAELHLHGRVRGVGLRGCVCDVVGELGLAGFCRNANACRSLRQLVRKRGKGGGGSGLEKGSYDDGCVVVVLEGSVTRISKFISFLKGCKGGAAVVRSVCVIPRMVTGFRRFEVLEDSKEDICSCKRGVLVQSGTLAEGVANVVSSWSSVNRSAGIMCSALGRWGQWGNQVFQYVFLRLYASIHGVHVKLPRDWVGQKWLQSSRDTVVEWVDFDASATEQTSLVCDQPMLSHLGWLRWARRREPLRTLEMDGLLSKRALRQKMPTVSHSDLVDQTSILHSGSDFWGWFQFHTRWYCNYKREIRRLLLPCASLQDYIERCALAMRKRAGSRKLVGVHLRLLDYASTEIEAAKAVNAHSCEYPLHSLPDYARSPYATSLSVDMYAQNLRRLLRDEPAGVCVVVFSNDMTAALDMLKEFDANAPPYDCVNVPTTEIPLYLIDFFLMQRMDVLLSSNSSFSFCAAMLNEENGARFWRPSALGSMLEEFNPWDAKPVVTSSTYEVKCSAVNRIQCAWRSCLSRRELLGRKIRRLP